jgi:transcriptional regulator with XRE-family HTH domain
LELRRSEISRKSQRGTEAMSSEPERTKELSAAEIERLRQLNGLSLSGLASKAQVHLKTLKSWMKGKPAFLSNINSLAAALNVEPAVIIRETAVHDLAFSPTSETEVELNFTIRGKLSSKDQLPPVITLGPTLLAKLAQMGIEVTGHKSTVSFVEHAGDALTRIIVLIYGQLENGNPFWLFASVKPAKYSEFLTAQENGTLNLYEFAPYGHIIVSGEGPIPPDDIVKRVANMYKVDSTRLLQELKGPLPDT